MSTFSFVIFTDSHLTVDPKAAEPWWNAELLGRSSDILTVAVEDAVALEPEFVVHLGDVTDKADRDSFQVAGEILSKLNCTLHFTPGNHDTWTQGSRHVASELLQVSGPPMYRSVPYKGWRLLLIDSAYWMYQDGTIHPHIDWDRYKDIVVPPSQVEWIERELQRDPDTPTLCFIHVPLALREQYPPIILPPRMPFRHGPLRIARENAGPRSDAGRQAICPHMRQGGVQRPRSLARLYRAGFDPVLSDRCAGGVSV